MALVFALRRGYLDLDRSKTPPEKINPTGPTPYLINAEWARKEFAGETNPADKYKIADQLAKDKCKKLGE